jgi:hypothetical protein
VWHRANNPTLSEKINLLKRQQYKIVDKLLMSYVPSGTKRISKSKVSNLKNLFYIHTNIRRTNSPMKTNKKEWPMCKLSSENINMMSSFAMMKKKEVILKSIIIGITVILYLKCCT